MENSTFLQASETERNELTAECAEEEKLDSEYPTIAKAKTLLWTPSSYIAGCDSTAESSYSDEQEGEILRSLRRKLFSSRNYPRLLNTTLPIYNEINIKGTLKN